MLRKHNFDCLRHYFENLKSNVTTEFGRGNADINWLLEIMFLVIVFLIKQTNSCWREKIMCSSLCIGKNCKLDGIAKKLEIVYHDATKFYAKFLCIFNSNKLACSFPSVSVGLLVDSDAYFKVFSRLRSL